MGKVSVGTCFGFSLEATGTWQLLREGTGRPLEVIDSEIELASPQAAPLLSWSPSRDNGLDARLFGSEEGGYVLEIAGEGRYQIDPRARRVVRPVPRDPLTAEIRLLGLPILLCFLAGGQLPLHAGCVAVGDQAVLLAAPGRHGKTSLSAAFVRSGHRLLSEDLACVDLSDSPSVVPGPTSLRVRRDMSSLLPLRGTESLGEYEDRTVVRALEPGDCTPVPLAGIVFLKDFSDEITWAERTPSDALRDLWFLSLHLPTPEDRERKFDQLVRLSEEVTVLDLTRPGRPEALDETVRAVETRLGLR